MTVNGGCRCLEDIRRHGGVDKHRRVMQGIITLRKKIEELENDLEEYVERDAGASL